MTEIIKQPEVESGLSKQLLGNFQTDNSSDHKYSRLNQKMELLIKRTCIAMMELIKPPDGTIIGTVFFIVPYLSMYISFKV